MRSERKAKAAMRDAKPRPDPSERERTEIEAARAYRDARRSPVTVQWSARGAGIIESPHSDHEGYVDRLFEALGTRSTDAANAALTHLDHACRSRGDNAHESTIALNASLAFVQGIAPRDELEGSLALQMAGCHVLAMEMLGRARQTDRTDHMQLYGGLGVKLQRTFVLQVEALAKLRGGGKQEVEVRHTYVNENAVAGPATGGGGAAENGDQPHAQGLVHLPGPSVDQVRSADQGGNAMPGAGDSGPEAMQDARRKVARAA